MMRALLLTLAATFGFAASPRPADAAQPGRIPSALVITKSTNKNQVRYAVDVTDACAPANAAPVHPYWRMLERGPDVTEALTSREQGGFGLESQTVDGPDVRIVLRGLRARPITIHTFRTNEGRCESSADMVIGGAEARIASVFVKLSLFGISYIDVTGLAPTGASVRERLSP